MSQRAVVQDKKSIPSKLFIETKKPFECLIGCRANHLQQCPVCLSWHRITSSLLFGKLLILDQSMFVLFSFMFGQEMYQISSLHYWWWSPRTFIPLWCYYILGYTASRIWQFIAKTLNPHWFLRNGPQLLYLENCFIFRNSYEKDFPFLQQKVTLILDLSLPFTGDSNHALFG